MIAREYNKRITVNVYTDVSDGFGGYLSSSAVYMEAWAKLINPSSNRATDLGLSDLYNSLVFRVRFNEDLLNARQFSLSYNGGEYTINGITDVDQFHRELEIVCTKANPETISSPSLIPHDGIVDDLDESNDGIYIDL
jgi:SPP1 family predicted phage head-tail adaptor